MNPMRDNGDRSCDESTATESKLHSFISLVVLSLTVTHRQGDVSRGVAHVVADRAAEQSRPARLQSDVTSATGSGEETRVVQRESV